MEWQKNSVYIVKKLLRIILINVDVLSAATVSPWVRVIMSRIAALKMIQLMFQTVVIVIKRYLLPLFND